MRAQRGHGQSGQAYVELLVVLPVLLLLLEGTFLFGTAWSHRIQLHTAARYGAWSAMRAVELPWPGTAQRTQAHYAIGDGLELTLEERATDLESITGLVATMPQSYPVAGVSLIAGMGMATHSKVHLAEAKASWDPGLSLPKFNYRSRYQLPSGVWSREEVWGRLQSLATEAQISKEVYDTAN